MGAEEHISAEGINSDFEYVPNYNDLEEVQSLQEYARDKLITPGEYSRDIEVGKLGSKIFYVQEANNVASSVAGSLMADTLMDELDVEGPEIFHDEESEKILVEEVPGVPSNQYRAINGFKMAKHILGKELRGNRDQVNEAIGLKYFLGDPDIPPNIVVTEESASPIDFDKTGKQANRPLEEAEEYAEEVYTHFNWHFSQKEFEDTLEAMVEEVDLSELENELYSRTKNASESERRIERLIGDTIENIERVR